VCVITKCNLETQRVHNNNNNNNGVKLEEEHCYEYLLESVETSHEGKVTILWNQVKSDGTIPNNKPYIIIRDNEEETCILIVVAI
jgi:hypothetical protein